MKKYQFVSEFSNTVIGNDDLDTFGQVLPGRSMNDNNPSDLYKFTGHSLSRFVGKRDAEIGLDGIYPERSLRVIARNYDPEIGRFLSVDPLADKFPGWSPYNYTMNNPVNLIDPDGREVKNPNNLDLGNRKLVSAIKVLNAAIASRFGIDNNSFTLRITGGDRYKKDGKIYSSSNDTEITNAALGSKHLKENGARAVDIKFQNRSENAVSNADILDLAKELGFDYTEDEGNHLHMNLGESESVQAAPDTRPTDEDLNSSLTLKESWKLLKSTFANLKKTINGEKN